MEDLVANLVCDAAILCLRVVFDENGIKGDDELLCLLSQTATPSSPLVISESQLQSLALP